MDRSQKVEIAGLTAVVVSLLFVAYQIDQSNRIARATTSYELSRNWMELNRFFISEPAIADLRIKFKNKDYVPESEAELEMSIAYARMLVNLWTAMEEAYENGLASDDYLQIAKDDVSTLLEDRPGILPIFGKVFADYDLVRYEVLDPIREKLENLTN